MTTQFNGKLMPLSLLIGTTLLSACGSSDKNNAPELSGNLAPVVAENTTLVAQYSATDADGDFITFSLSGDDSTLFTITQDGHLSFNKSPDFEQGETGPYQLNVIATDDGAGSLTGELAITVTVGDVKDTPSLAIVQTVAPDYSSSQVAYLGANEQQVATGYYIKDKSDYTLSSYKTDIYHIGRLSIDEISKYNGADASSRDQQIWSYSTQDANDSLSRNPYTLVSLNETKAYLIRYGSSKVWIVNPQASASEDFKIGELDLTSYIPQDNSKGTPTPSAAVIHQYK